MVWVAFDVPFGATVLDALLDPARTIHSLIVRSENRLFLLRRPLQDLGVQHSAKTVRWTYPCGSSSKPHSAVSASRRAVKAMRCWLTR